MKQLTLMRHAKSSWHHEDLTDFERPLNERGRRAAPLMGAYLGQRFGGFDRIVSSPATRAITTARMVCQALGQDDNEILVIPALYLAEPDTLLDVIHALDTKDNSALLVGHNPGISHTGFRLAAMERRKELPTAAALTLELPARHWRQVNFGSAHLIELQTPKRLRRSSQPSAPVPD